MKFMLVSIILAASITGLAQSLEIPQKEFSIDFPKETIVLKRGENKKIEIRILKSKAYQKGKMQMGLSSSLPPGISISFDPEKGNVDLTQATITAQSDTSPGQYSLIVNATINYKTKGSVLKISVE
jgi:uncharacterized membrane protein